MPLLKAPLSVSGAQILNADGAAVRLAGVNWGGAHQDGCVPAGLDKLHRDAIAARIAGWGLNHVRLPFAVGAFMTNAGALKTGPAADQWRLAANPDLAGMSPWEVYQACVTSLVNAGLAVIPNQHMLFPGWCCSEADCQGLWYNGSWPVPTYLACWQLVAERFASENLVVGYDLHNEPRPSRVNGELLVPSWGDGNQPTDIWLMYMGTIRRIQALAPGKLWFCEGLNYASNLAPAAAFPVGIPGTVYSLHDYSWFHPSGQNLTAYYNQMDAAGGYLVLDGQAPLWVGEFGANTDVATASLDTGWLADFLSWAQARRLHWCWWQLSAQAVKGTEPVTNTPKSQDGQRESYGLLSGHDWLGDQSDMLALLAPLMS